MLTRKLRAAAEQVPAWQGLTGAVEIVCPMVLTALSFLALVGNTYNPFLYFQF